MADRVVKYVLKGDVTQFGASMKAAGASVGKLAGDMTKLDAKGAKMRQGLTSVGDTAGKIGLAAAAGLGAVVLVTAKFDKQMSNVQAATGETAASMDLLREAAIQAGADTAFSASEAAQGIEELAKAGVSTGDILGGGLAGALDLAAAGQIGVGEAAEYSAKAMTMFNLAGEDVTHVADLLAAAAGKAVGEVGDFGQALNQAGLVAAQTGLTIEDTIGTLAAFAQAGLQGSDAGTALKSMLQRLQNPLGQGAKALETYGIAAYDANGNFVGITEVAQQLQEKLGGLDQATRDAAMSQIFGSDAVRAAAILYREGAVGIQGWIDKTNDAGFAAEQAAAKMDNLAGDWEEFTGSLETALIGAGEGSQGILRGMVQNATELVNAFNDLSPTAKNTAVALTAITAVTGGSLWLGAKTIQGISNTRTALANLGISAETSSKALRNVGKFAGAAGLALAGFAAADWLTRLDDEALPSLEALTEQLLDLSVAGSTAALSAEFDSLGESITRLTDKNAAQKFNDALSGITGGMLAGNLTEAQNEIEALDAALSNLVARGSADAAASALEGLAKSQDLSKGEMEALLGVLPQYEAALTGSENDARLAATATGQFAGSLGDVAGEAQEAADALQNQIDAMRESRDQALSAFDAETRYAEALADSRKALKENGRTLDISTAKGRANRDALSAQADAFNNLSDEAKNAPGAHRAAIESFVDMAVKMKMGEAEARRLARSIIEIPSKRVTITADTSQASGAIDSFIRSQSGRVINIGTRVLAQQQGPGRAYEANGGVLDFYANGGMRENHVAQIAPAGAWRVWAEEETGGEAYIPLAASKRPRSRQIAAETVARLGGNVEWYAKGGTTEPLTARDFRQFNLSGSSDVRREFEEFRRAVRDAGGEWTAQMARAARQALATSRAYERHAKHLDKLTDRRNALASDVSGNFDNDPFGNGLSGAFMQLEADRNDSRTQTREMRRLRRLGLDGAAFQALSASGDLNTMSQINTRGEVRRLEQLFAERARAQNTSGQVATAEMTKTIRNLERQMKKQERTLDRLEGAVERGARRGVGDRGQTTQQRRRAGR